MATEKYPNRNVNIPYDDAQLATVRGRLAPPRGYGGLPMSNAPADGKGSRREVRKGEWVDDRVFPMGGPSLPSKDSPPELEKDTRVLPTFVDTKAYQVVLLKPVVVDGRMLAPAKSYIMAGHVCTPITASILDAVELGDTPVNPNPPDPAPEAASKSGDKKTRK